MAMLAIFFVVGLIITAIFLLVLDVMGWFKRPPRGFEIVTKRTPPAK
jgi:hypothetical protein